MNIITEPRVHVLSSQVFHPHPAYKIPDDGTDVIKICAMGAKLCYHSFDEYARANMANQQVIIESRHGSVLEHAVFGLVIEGITRGCSLEIVRHRAGFGYSQRSTRYTDESDATVVAEPELAQIVRYVSAAKKQSHAAMLDIPLEDHKLLENFTIGCQTAFDRYNEAVRLYMKRAQEKGLTGTAARKYARGKARDLLPHALETKMLVTGNLRAWRHFLEMRSSRHAEAEIRRLSNHVFRALYSYAGFYLDDYQHEKIDGFYEYTTPHGKV